MSAAKACGNCGAPSSDDTPVPDHCGKCPPWVCDQCGAVTSMATPCSCWIDLRGMGLADIKALFAQDGTFSIDTRSRP